MHELTAIVDGHGYHPLRPWIWGGAVSLLVLPAIAMHWFPASGVEWSGGDFVVMAVMLAVACGIYEIGARCNRDLAYRVGVGLAVLTGFLTVWVNLAVGMLGDEGNALNLMFAGVLVVALLGARAVRLHAPGMARAMAAAGIAQLLVLAVALAIGGYRANALLFSALFALPWFASALLFRQAAARNR